jgi:hypothetical protein
LQQYLNVSDGVFAAFMGIVMQGTVVKLRADVNLNDFRRTAIEAAQFNTGNDSSYACIADMTELRGCFSHSQVLHQRAATEEEQHYSAGDQVLLLLTPKELLTLVTIDECTVNRRISIRRAYSITHKQVRCWRSELVLGRSDVFYLRSLRPTT